ncbi:hypothetical protein, partial [Blautia wexlerae]|uniref:hypothetical protein n=1 Tax=Blautia wexlerae TaxID=418240 RepID=UPI0034A436BD
ICFPKLRFSDQRKTPQWQTGLCPNNQKAEMPFTNKIASDISALSAVLSDILQTQDKYTIWG